MSIKYLVDIEMQVSGAPEQRMSGLSASASSLKKDMAGVGTSLLDGFTGAVESVGAKLLTLGQIGLGAGIAAAAYGVASINKGLEDTRISIGAILQVSGAASNIEMGVAMGADAMARMRKDAAALPGTFDSLIDVFRAISTSGFNAGMAEPALEKMAERGMAAGAVMGLRSDMVGREMAMLLDGRAGAHNIFGARLGLSGDKAKEFNASSSDKRVEVLTAALGKYDDSIKAFGTSYTALTTTFETNARKFLGDATAPLFEKIKGTLGDVNNWFDKNQAVVQLYADNIGYALGKAFDYGKEVFLEYGPLLFDFAERAYNKLVRVWQDMQPLVHDVGEAIKSFLSDDKSFDKIETILKLYIAAKGLGAAASIGSTVYKLGSGVAGLFGGGGAAGAGAGTAAGAGELGVGVAAIEAGVTGFAAAGTALSATVVAVPTAIGAAIGATAYEIRDAQSKALTVDAKGGGAYGYNDQELASREKLISGGIEAGVTLHGLSDIPVDAVGVGFDNVGDAANSLAFTLRSLAKSGDFDAVRRINEGIDKEDKAKADTAAANEAAGDALKKLSETKTEYYGGFGDTVKDKDGVMNAITIMAQKAIDAANDQKAKAAEDAKRKKAAEGKGGMTINKVDITVSSNQAPDQIARATLAELQHLRRYRTSSPRTLNFSAGR